MSLKEKLHAYCTVLVTERLARIKTEIAQIQTSANAETKSTSGDKYETGRAMAQLEVERHTQQLLDAEKLLATLHDLMNYKTIGVARPGSLVYTSSGIYYVSISLGLVEMEGQKYFIVSVQSPIGKLLLGKKIGDTILWNGMEYALQTIE